MPWNQLIGNEEWPFPIPLIKDGVSWRFDAVAGAEEVLFHRIGRNELNTIEVCNTFVQAQQDYAKKAHDGRVAGAYARMFASTPGKQDGIVFEKDLGPDTAKLAAEIASFDPDPAWNKAR
jgi:hypothetical protein